MSEWMEVEQGFARCAARAEHKREAFLADADKVA